MNKACMHYILESLALQEEINLGYSWGSFVTDSYNKGTILASIYLLKDLDSIEIYERDTTDGKRDEDPIVNRITHRGYEVMEILDQELEAERE